MFVCLFVVCLFFEFSFKLPIFCISFYPKGMMNQQMYSPEQFLADGPQTGMDVGGMDAHDMMPTSQVTTLLTKGEMEMNGLHHAQGAAVGVISNPIDKLYSMQDSYFNAVE